MKIFSILFLCFACCLGATTPVFAQSPVELSRNGDFFEGEDGWLATGATAAKLAGTPDAPVLQLDTRVSPGDMPWSGVVMQPLNVTLKKGEKLQISLRARSPQSVTLGAMVEHAGAPYEKIVEAKFELTPEWKTFQIEGALAQDYAAGEARITLHAGYANGTIELSEIHLNALDRPGKARAMASTPVQSLLVNGDFSKGLDNWKREGAIETDAKVQPNVGPQGAAALRIVPQNAPNPDTPWQVQIGQPVSREILSGSAVYLRAWLRAPGGKGRAALIWEEAGEPFDKMIYQTVQLTGEWREFRFVGYASKTYAAQATQIKFFTGFGAEPIEIANVRADSRGRAPRGSFDVTPTTIDYKTLYQPDETWKKAALERIEKIRKAPFTVKVVDEKGQPVAGANVQIEMTRHAFRWGLAAKASRFVVDSPDNRKFRELTARWFNTVTFENDLKWNEEPPDLDRLRTVDKALGWLKARDIDVRGHTMMWGGQENIPANVWAQDAATLRASAMNHIDWIGKRYRGDVYAWDVVNEAADKTELWDKIGWENFAEAYKRARAAAPAALLAYNDYNITNTAGDAGHRAKVLARVKTLIDNGAPLDIIGDQAHMGWPLTPIKRYLENLDEVAALGKPIEITEFDLGLSDDAVHGQYVSDFLIASFSHPNVQSIIQWGMWESDHWRASEGTALVRRDWSLRPAGAAYENLVTKQWWTNESGISSNGGDFARRGFLGDYRITATKDGRSVITTAKLPKEGATVEVRLP